MALQFEQQNSPAGRIHHELAILTREATVSSSSPCSESIICIRNEAGPLAMSMPSSPANPKIDRAQAVASKALDGSTATKAAMMAVTAHPVAVIFCIIATPLCAPTTRLPSVTKSTAPDTATIAPLVLAKDMAASTASIDSWELSTPLLSRILLAEASPKISDAFPLITAGLSSSSPKQASILKSDAETATGSSPVVLLLHGFPDLWYTWRHQILSLASRGYRAVAPDLRGFGDTDAPADVRSYSILHIVGDLVALIDSLGQDKVFVVGHDWGATAAWALCMMRPDRVKALVNLSVVFSPRDPAKKPVDCFRELYGGDHYICMFQEPGVAEATFAQMGTKLLVKSFLGYREPEARMESEVREFGVDSELPPWLTEEDVDYYASKFDKSGFTGGLNYYRNMNWNWELTAPWTGVKLQVPVKFMVGDLDLAYHMGSVKDYIHKGGFERDVPLLQDVVVMKGVGHFITQERPKEISDHIYDFIQKF